MFRVRAGDEEAVQQLTRANLLFVVSVARQHMGRGLPLIDLIAEGADTPAPGPGPG